MKLYFRIEKKVKLDSLFILSQIKSYLSEKEYRVIAEDVSIVKFDDKIGIDRKKAISKSDYYTRVDEGKFEIVLNKDGINSLILIYRISILPEFLLLGGISLAGTFIDNHAFFLSIAFSLNLFAKIFYLYNNLWDNVLKNTKQ
jgi:predicted nucleic acid-binding protein